MEFWTIEILDGPRSSARRWRDAYGERLIEAVVTHGGKEWSWLVRDWGVLLEVSFADESDWLRFRATFAVQAALDAVPDPVHGLFVYNGRGGSSGARVPRRPRPRNQSDGAPLPEPEPELRARAGLLDDPEPGFPPGYPARPGLPGRLPQHR